MIICYQLLSTYVADIKALSPKYCSPVPLVIKIKYKYYILYINQMPGKMW